MSAFSLVGGTPARASADTAELGATFASVLVGAQAGADWAWTLLYRSVAPAVRGYLRANGADDADNLLGEVFLQLARNLATFEGGEDRFRSWVFTVAHHRVIDERRRRRRRPAVAMAQVPERAAPGDDGQLLNGLLTAEARALLDTLTPQQRDVVLLRVFADLPLEDVARIVGRPVSAVKSLQHRGLAALRKKILDSPYPDAPVWR
jgi:RNA polymerase sigma-70 factor (ECF subfamily)